MMHGGCSWHRNPCATCDALGPSAGPIRPLGEEEEGQHPPQQRIEERDAEGAA
jgi:hypothetical protein